MLSKQSHWLQDQRPISLSLTVIMWLLTDCMYRSILIFMIHYCSKLWGQYFFLFGMKLIHLASVH